MSKMKLEIIVNTKVARTIGQMEESLKLAFEVVGTMDFERVASIESVDDNSCYNCAHGDNCIDLGIDCDDNNKFVPKTCANDCDCNPKCLSEK
mgnify:CR=1 FL=1